MKICTRCGHSYQDQFESCPNCGLGDSSSTYRIKHRESLGNDTGGYSSSNIKERIKPVEELLSNGWKVFIASIICLLPIVGQIIGFAAGAYFLRQRNKDLVQFGKAITIQSLIFFILSLVSLIIMSIVIGENIHGIMYFFHLILN